MARRCPQCRDELEELWFQYPVKTCLACYASLPWNDDLLQLIVEGRREGREEQVKAAWAELRQRATRSKYARKKRLSEQRGPRGLKRAAPTLESMIQRRLTDAEVGPGELTSLSDMTRCDGCTKLFEPSNLHDCPGPGDVRPLVCSDCKARAESGDLQTKCYLCQRLMPIVHIYVGDDNKWRCSECHERTSQFQGGV